MKIKLILLLMVSQLAGCQAMQDYMYCMNIVDQKVPAITEQRYVRTETVCKSKDETVPSPYGPQYTGKSSSICTTTPIYETIVLNQADRDKVYNQCKATIQR